MLTEELIDSRFSVHDSNHIEVKLDYSVQPGTRKSRYRVDTYLFVPRALGLHRDSYPASQFYGDVQAYIRFKSPTIGLETLADAASPRSPLHTVRDAVRTLRTAPHEKKARQLLGQELRLFGCAVRSSTRDRASAISKALARSGARGEPGAASVGDISVLGTRFLDGLDSVFSAWRALRPDFFDGALPRQARDTFLYVDEYISLVVEEQLTRLVRAADRSQCPALLEMRGRLCDFIVDLQQGRSSADYATAVPSSGERGKKLDDETYIFHQGKLKKFVQSVLWLEVSRAKEGRRTADLGAAIAAGTAMAFAVVATIWQARRFVTDTVAFVIAAVVTYILKDRIKDWLKGYFNASFSRWLSDYSLSIRDPVAGSVIGRCRESFSFVSGHQIPQDVLECRHSNARDSIEPAAKPENVIRYSKQVRLKNDELMHRFHQQQLEVHDILRLSVWHLLEQADDPKARVSLYSPEEDRVVEKTMRKVYHVNMVMVFEAPSAPTKRVLRKVRVVFDKKGIRRLEEIST